MSIGTILTRCPHCQGLSFVFEDDGCDKCGYTPDCRNCGRAIPPEQYDESYHEACSSRCSADLEAQR